MTVTLTDIGGKQIWNNVYIIDGPFEIAPNDIPGRNYLLHVSGNKLNGSTWVSWQ